MRVHHRREIVRAASTECEGKSTACDVDGLYEMLGVASETMTMSIPTDEVVGA